MACDYCGSAKATCSQGRVEWCGSDRCSQLHDWATYEPRFEFWMEPTIWQRLRGRLLYWALWLPCEVTGRWCFVAFKGTRRYELAYWFAGRSWGASERSEGRA